MRAEVAIIIRTKNRSLLLKRAIESVLQQTFENWFVVIVNDGGSEDAVHIILDQQINKLCGRYLLISNPVSVGMEAASNIGIEACDSEYICIHDDDDTWHPEFLEECITSFKAMGNSDVGGIVTRSMVIYEKTTFDTIKEVRRKLFKPTKNISRLAIVDLAERNMFPPISFLFRRDVYEEVGGFNPKFEVLGDWDFNLRIIMKYEIVVIPKCLANYHIRKKRSDLSNSIISNRKKHLDIDVYIKNILFRSLSSMGLLVNIESYLMQRSIRKSLIRKFNRIVRK